MHALLERRIADDDARLPARNMRELRRPGDVADGEDTAVRGLQAVVGLDPELSQLHAGLREIELLDVGNASGRYKKVTAFDDLRAAEHARYLDTHADAAARDVGDLRALAKDNPFACKPVDE